MTTVPNKKKLVIKVVYGKDIRRWRYPSFNEYANLTTFIKTTFNLRVFYLQFVDDEDDRLTIASQAEFEDAVESATAECRKSLKIYVTYGSLHQVPIFTDEGVLLCYCASRFEKMDTTKAYGGCRVTCDSCNQTCDPLLTVYHCVGGRNQCHRHGYDLCNTCYTERIRPQKPEPIEIPLEMPSLPVSPVLPPVLSLLTMQVSDNSNTDTDNDNEVDIYTIPDDNAQQFLVPYTDGEEDSEQDVDMLIEVENDMRVEDEQTQLHLYLDKLEEHLPLLEAFEAEEEEDEIEVDDDEEYDDELDMEIEVDDETSSECTRELVLSDEEYEDDVEEEDEEKVYAYMDYDEEQARTDAVERLLSHEPSAVNEERFAKAQATEMISLAKMEMEEFVENEVVESEILPVVEVEVKSFVYERELGTILAMGFKDVVRIQQLLLQYHGSIERVFMEMY